MGEARPVRAAAAFRPLAGVRVVEFSQMVMGPTCGLILADLGADVIKVEPPKGDRTRFFKGPASGFFEMSVITPSAVMRMKALGAKAAREAPLPSAESDFAAAGEA